MRKESGEENSLSLSCLLAACADGSQHAQTAQTAEVYIQLRGLREAGVSLQRRTKSRRKRRREEIERKTAVERSLGCGLSRKSQSTGDLLPPQRPGVVQQCVQCEGSANGSARARLRKASRKRTTKKTPRKQTAETRSSPNRGPAGKTVAATQKKEKKKKREKKEEKKEERSR
ncbi:hypothetical protein TGDOM2_400720 [Toxoplasma gondii GAB2-2007-GAL-DOM2]|uniref:Uncharacterized protein n=1 Tax=Toxoplasma gondii GAB2-2007-GAL-DOM2 TaxID=1130820 RepID=A0A086JMM2_TOXGO|nr:hypothetical protein TGDOM2_400720 [Toxoplasma gondii GAB2-2007-GAL-DOM2]